MTYFVQDEVRARKFRITGIYETGFVDYDKLFVIADIRQIRRLNGWAPDEVSGLELQVDDYDHLDRVAEDLYFDIAEKQDRNGNTYYTRSIKELNPMIFDWLEVQDINVVVILILILAVAGFTMISGLLIIILERTNMIGILKALGEITPVSARYSSIYPFLDWQRDDMGQCNRDRTLSCSILFPCRKA